MVRLPKPEFYVNSEVPTLAAILDFSLIGFSSSIFMIIFKSLGYENLHLNTIIDIIMYDNVGETAQIYVLREVGGTNSGCHFECQPYWNCESCW